MSEHLQPGLHPDPDTLSAFAEGVLPEHDRLACMLHLADCAACREVVYLTEEPLAVPAADEIAWWKRWLTPIPILSVAALIGVLVLSVSLSRLERPAANSPPAEVATSVPQAVVPAPAMKAEVEVRHRATRHTATGSSAFRAPTRVETKDVPQAVPPQVLSSRANLPAAPPPPFPPPPLPQPAPAENALSVIGSVSTPAVIAGTVTDEAGAVIPGAGVSVRPVSGATGVHATTDQTGQFRIDGLAPGKYQLRVTRSGFQPATKDVEVKPDLIARADTSLSVGSVTETVEVTAAASPVVSNESARVTIGKSGFAGNSLPGRTAAKKSAANVGVSVSLPSKLAAAATASKDKVMIAADSAGTLFRSDDAGRKWKSVKAVWQGKVAELAAEAAEFRLTTNTGAVWLSRDGRHWYSAPQPRR